MIFCDMHYIAESLVSNAVVSCIQSKCIWPILSQVFLLIGMCAWLFSY